jgi:hypothetical protein
MLYSIILPILGPCGGGGGATDFCASDRWSFEGSILVDAEACTVCIEEASIMKIVIIYTTSIGFESSL